MRTDLSTDLPTAYDPSSTEARWYGEWERRGYFRARPDSGRDPFCIVLPPPNVTGSLHIGHALQHTLQDAIVRRKRMQGYETLWLPGTDHAGIATQVVVERELAREGLTRQAIGREAFVRRVWEWKERYGNRIVEQMKALGNSCDWTRLGFTMDEDLSRAVREAFVRLFEDGLIYRGERIINWCPKDGTALSDSEVEHEEVAGELVTFAYPLADGSGRIEVATTRVETMLGDTGIAVHPVDERYRALVGRTARHPFDGRELPIVADDGVDPSFGTGAVKVTPAHDPTDFEIAERTGLPRLNVLNPDATIADTAPERFRGLDRYAARKAVREALDELGLLVKVEAPYPHMVGHCYRCGTEIEPWLSGQQWFVAVERLKGPATAVAEDGRLTFFPERWAKPYTVWLDNLRDWNISRQLWWGHRIPVWYCANGHMFVAREDPSACPECSTTDLEQDPDVLDTWFSSQLWPFSTLGWPDDTDDLRTFYPTSALVTGYEILYLWVARMVMSGLYFMRDVPFHQAVIHGLVRAEDGKKMSKSLGNIIDPLDVIGEYGADALRFALLRLATGGQDIPLSMKAIEDGRHFANKIWNAARLVLGSHDGGEPAFEDLGLVERWILSRHEACRAAVDGAIEGYRFSDAATTLRRFVWSELCDWALEMEKPRLADPAAKGQAAALLAWILERTLRLLHPAMPFVTEELWQRLRRPEWAESIVVAPWPEPNQGHVDGDADGAMEVFMRLVTEVRRLKPYIEGGLAYRLTPTPEDRRLLAGLSAEFTSLTGLTVSVPMGDDEPVLVTRASGGRDVKGRPQALLSALQKRRDEAAARLRREREKLENQAFLRGASPDAVARARANRQDLEQEIASLENQLAHLSPQ